MPKVRCNKRYCKFQKGGECTAEEIELIDYRGELSCASYTLKNS